MKQEDVEFVRKWWPILHGAHYVDVVVRINGEDKHYEADEWKRLLSLLIESEAMREKAEFFKWYSESNQRYLVLQSFILLPYLTKEEQQHYDWSDAEWIVAKKKEWGI